MAIEEPPARPDARPDARPSESPPDKITPPKGIDWLTLGRGWYGPDFEIKTPKPDVHRELARGWLLPYLLGADDRIWGRWDYWAQIASQQESPDGRHLPDAPIPQIAFLGEGGTEIVHVDRLQPAPPGAKATDPGMAHQVDDDLPAVGDAYQDFLNGELEQHHPPRRQRIHRVSVSGGWKRTRKMWEASLEAVSPSWGGWGSDTYWHYVLDWLLYGFGATDQLPREPDGAKGASDRLYQVFNADVCLLYPYDYIGDIFAESRIGRGAAFYPTPHNVVGLITEMTIANAESDGRDSRLLTMNDPCIGSGRFGLFASNHTLCLSGQDINPIMVKASLVNAFLYAPWMARSIPWVWDLADAERARVATERDEPAPPATPPVERTITLSRRMQRMVNKGQGVLL